MAEPPPFNTFTWTSLFTGGTLLTAIVGLITLVIKQIGPWRKQTIDAEAQLRVEMADTIKDLRAENLRLETKIETNRKQYEAERSLDRHKINNLSQIIDTIFILLEASPEKVSEVVQKMREMRSRQLEQEAVESATLRAEAMKPKDSL